ncbi:MAG TPA: RHS repeat-associated core domain-containing protein, partial [Longimicrobium sp.]|nr:RHS repeat-associated core domain-containing protein [Longimicrobium sp.]
GGGVADTLGWDALGQLASVRRAGVSVTYGYNAFGERVRRTQGTQTRRTLYDDGDDLLAEIDGSGSVVAAYTHLPGIDRPFSVATWGALRYFVAESPGTVVGLLDEWAATPAARYRYTPFGALQGGSDVPAPLGFMGRERDATTGMYYMRNRWYDPALERFVSEDPIGVEGGVHPYLFARNAPTGGRDPSGLYVCVERNVWETVPGFEDTLEAATGTHVMRDPDGCIRHAWANPKADPRLRWTQETFLRLVRRKDVRYNIRFSSLWVLNDWRRRSSGFGPVVAGAREYTATILRSEIGTRYDECNAWEASFAVHTLSSLVVHELIGHGYTTLRKDLLPATDDAAIIRTNEYLTVAGLPTRCGHGEP